MELCPFAFLSICPSRQLLTVPLSQAELGVLDWKEFPV